MVEYQRNLCRFHYLDNATFEPSKIKLVQVDQKGFKGSRNSYPGILDMKHFNIIFLSLD